MAARFQNRRGFMCSWKSLMPNAALQRRPLAGVRSKRLSHRAECRDCRATILSLIDLELTHLLRHCKWVGMTMHQLPISGLQPEHTGDTSRYLGHFLASGNLCFPALDFGNAREIVRDIFLDEFNVCIPPVAIFGCGDGQSLFNVLATSTTWTKGIAKCHVFSRAE